MLLVSWCSIFSIIQYWKMSKMLSHTVLIPIKLEVAFYLPQTKKPYKYIFVAGNAHILILNIFQIF